MRADGDVRFKGAAPAGSLLSVSRIPLRIEHLSCPPPARQALARGFYARALYRDEIFFATSTSRSVTLPPQS